jgi:septum formation protein
MTMSSATVNSLRLVLASASPRRKTLLEAAGLSFEIVGSGIDEIRRDGESASDFATRMAVEKALNVAARRPVALVLAADTIVECAGQILGKPADPAEARAMLATLSGNTHTVVTAFAIASARTISDSLAVVSRVTFRMLSIGEIADYVATGAPLDKAGAYGIQDAGAGFIAHVEGSRDNVMGLPVREVLAALRRHGLVAASPDSRGLE